MDTGNRVGHRQVRGSRESLERGRDGRRPDARAVANPVALIGRRHVRRRPHRGCGDVLLRSIGEDGDRGKLPIGANAVGGIDGGSRPSWLSGGCGHGDRGRSTWWSASLRGDRVDPRRCGGADPVRRGVAHRRHRRRWRSPHHRRREMTSTCGVDPCGHRLAIRASRRFAESRLETERRALSDGRRARDPARSRFAWCRSRWHQSAICRDRHFSNGTQQNVTASAMWSTTNMAAGHDQRHRVGDGHAPSGRRPSRPRSRDSRNHDLTVTNPVPVSISVTPFVRASRREPRFNSRPPPSTATTRPRTSPGRRPGCPSNGAVAAISSAVGPAAMRARSRGHDEPSRLRGRG